MSGRSCIAIVRQDEGSSGQRIHHVFEQTVQAAVDDLIGALMDGRILADYNFVLGAALILDAVLNDEFDFSQPVLTVEQAYRDAHEIREARALVSAALSNWCEKNRSAR